MENSVHFTGFKAIVDCNSFYCSCERLFRPDLWNKPVVVLSNNDGCIISRSDEAKALGVGMTGPYFEAKPVIEKHGITVFSSNYNLYGDLSWRVMETLRMLAGHDKVEVYSVDEAFLDLASMPSAQLHDAACNIKNTTEQWTGIKVSVGVAPSKVLSKMANRMAKKDKQGSGCVIVLDTHEKIAAALQQCSVNDIWGVGYAYAEKLHGLGIHTAWQLRNMPEEWAHTNMGGVTGVRLIRELRGIPCIPMDPPLVTKKMIATTRMFGRPVSTAAEIKEAIATYTSRAAEKLRRQRSAASVISVFVVPKEKMTSPRFRHGPMISSHVVLPAATSFTNELIKPAMELVDKIFREGSQYKKAGVMLSGIVPDASIQANLFQPPQKNNGRLLMDMVDNVNFSMRDDVLKFAASGTTRDWKMRQELRSKRHTTRWEELPELK